MNFTFTHSLKNTLRNLQTAPALLLIMTTSLFATNAQAESLTDVNEIIKQSNLASYYVADDGRAQARMVIVDSKGHKQMRQFTILRKDQEDLGNQDMLVFFSRPTDVKGTVFRVTKKVEADPPCPDVRLPATVCSIKSKSNHISNTKKNHG